MVRPNQKISEAGPIGGDLVLGLGVQNILAFGGTVRLSLRILDYFQYSVFNV